MAEESYNFTYMFFHILFALTAVVFLYMRTVVTTNTGIGDITSIQTGPLNITGDIKNVLLSDKSFFSIFIGAVVLLFFMIVFYFFIDYETEGEEGISNFYKLFFIWGILYGIVYLINFIITDVVLSAELFLRIFFVVTLCFWAMTGPMYLAVSLVPSVVDVFENTFGYLWIVAFSNAREKMRIIRSRTYPSFEIPAELLLTKFRMDNFNDMFAGLMKKKWDEDNTPKLSDEIILDFYIDVHDDNHAKRIEVKETLMQLVRIKNKIGHMFWIYVSSLMAMITSVIALNESAFSDFFVNV